MKRSQYVGAIAIALAIGWGAYLVMDGVDSGVPTPVVAYTLLDGTRASTEQLRGKVVLISFWATSCTSCVEEMPQVVATHEKFKARGYETLSVAMSYDTPAYVVRLAQTQRLPFPVTIDSTGDIARSFGDVRLTPTSLLINRRGEIVKRYVGAPDFDALQALIERLLAQA